MSRKAAKFAKKSLFHPPPLNTCLVQFLGRVSKLGKDIFASFAPLREEMICRAFWSGLFGLIYVIYPGLGLA